MRQSVYSKAKSRLSCNIHQVVWLRFAAVAIALGSISLTSTAAEMPNACPVDGCLVTIESVEPMDGELAMTFKANFTPDNARNHLHVWWGEHHTVTQVGRNAQSEFGVEQGKWHRHDDYPSYITTGAASITVREGATTLCVTSADRGHNVLDAELFHCMDVSEHLN